MLIYVPLNHIDDNPYQRRAEYGDIEELAERIHAAKASYPDTLGLMQVPRGRVVVVDTDTVVGMRFGKTIRRQRRPLERRPRNVPHSTGFWSPAQAGL
jgi:hypothetical protein